MCSERLITVIGYSETIYPGTNLNEGEIQLNKQEY